MKQLYAQQQLELKTKFPQGKRCGDCNNFSRCSNTGTIVSTSQTFCKYNPSRFVAKQAVVQMDPTDINMGIVIKMC